MNIFSFFKKDAYPNQVTIKEDTQSEFRDEETLVNEPSALIDIKPSVEALNDNSSKISASMNDFNDSLDNLTKVTIAQANEVSSATSILETFNESMEQIALNITNVHIKVLDADRFADDGLETFTNLNQSLIDLQQSFNLVNNTVNSLVKKLESVNSITDSISQIATQTNLLSLNAAIEAARAGEAGRGFSVVAGEVRKLAENSKQSVLNITKILDEIKSDILTTSDAMKNGNNAISEQQATLESTKTSFTIIKDSIGEAANEIDLSIVNLCSSAEQRDEVTSLMNKVSNISQEHAALSEEIFANMDIQNKNISELNHAIHNLNSMV